MNDQQLHVIFGTGPLGTTLAEQLLDGGKHVRLLSKSGRNPLGQRNRLEVGAVDVASVSAAIEAADGAAFVYNCVNVPYQNWHDLLPPLYTSILRAAEAAEAPLIAADNLYAYGPFVGPITEDLPRTATTSKCKLRADLIEQMLGAHRDGRVEVAIIQGSDFFGPRAINAHMGKRTFEPILQGRNPYIIGEIDQPHTYTFVPDFATAMRIVSERWEAFGRTWIVPSAPALTAREFVRIAASIAGSKSQAKAIPDAVLFAAGVFVPTLKELRETLYQFNSPFVTDSTAFERTFNMSPTPIEVAMRATLEWVASTASTSQTLARVGTTS